MMKLVVLSCILAAASASVVAPIAPYAPLIYSAYAAPFAAPNYRGPLSLAPGQPADVLGADGRPLDTLEVNQDRAAHYTAKALEPFHLLKKRSAAFIAPAISTYALASTPLITPASPISYAAPISTHIAPVTYTSSPLVHVLKKRSAAFIAPAVSTYAVASTPLITPASPITYTAPLAAPLTHLTYSSTPLVHVLKKRSAPVLAPFAKLAVAPAPYIAHAGAITYSAPYGAAHIAPFTYAAAPYAHWYK